ncbi:MAG TPA: protein phosphatase 2C domain-containing protein [Polyangiaceae bacterium]|nr:protein phosphatase 2C domain-containing protein [Polyangiaceae bacterium]
MSPHDSLAASGPAVEISALTHAGTERARNEDHCAALIDAQGTALGIVADGVSGQNAAEQASRLAVEAALRSYAEQPWRTAAGKRLYRAAQSANIAVHDLALTVPELRGMATTFTAVAVAGGELAAVHVGDTRLYLVHDGRIRQLTKDHTVAAERHRLGLVRRDKLRTHPQRSTLTRSLGRELIAAVDRITAPVVAGDVVLVCSDGLYNVLEDDEIVPLVTTSAERACRALIDTANARGTPDNLTVAVVRVVRSVEHAARRPSLFELLRRVRGG